MTTENFTEIHRRQLSLRLENVLLYGWLGLLLFGPLAFGAVEPWSMFVMEGGAAALFLAWAARQILDDKHKVIWNPLFLPLGMFGILIGVQLALRLSAYPHDTLVLALLYGAYGILCFLASQTLLREAQARSLALIFCVYGGALACFALLQGISPNGKLYWLRQPRSGGWIYGPYVNHNHYAGLMEMLVPVPLVLAVSRIAPHRARAVAGACAVLMIGTIFLSGSRGGMLAVLCELVILSGLLVKQKRSLRTAIGIGVFLAILLGLLTWVGGNQLMERIASVGGGHSDLSADFRLSINRDGLRMFLQKPLLGWGLGSFPVVYPQFRTFYTNFFVNQAHNDYLQLLVETGALGFATMIWFVVTVYSRGLRKIGKWADDMSGAASLVCLLGLTGILVHSWVDFNLEIPANAALFYVVCTVAAAPPFAKPARKRRLRSQPGEEVEMPRKEMQPSATNF